MPTIVTIGEALVEIMRTVHDQPLDRPATFVGPFPSGAPAIFASAAARLGASVGLVASVGDDAFGDCIATRLLSDGIDCAALRRVPDRLTAIAFVAYRSDGSRSFVFHMPQSAAAVLDSSQMPPRYLANTRFLHVMGSALTLGDAARDAIYSAAASVHEQGGIVSLDPNLRPELMPVGRIRSVCQPIVRRAQIVMPSGGELSALTGCATAEEGARLLFGEGVKLVALKQGERGSTLITPQETIVVPPYQVQEVDPTGAGDCFDAALLVGLSEGMPLRKAGALANAVGALATTRLGPMEGVFYRAAVLAFMASQGRPLD